MKVMGKRLLDNYRTIEKQLSKYKVRRIPENYLEYFIQKEKNRLFRKLVDIDDSFYIPDIIIDKALNFINRKLGKKSTKAL
ncbi:MAG: hypothetical protein PWQ77_1983 [Kosmotogales bacterium]|nr:hypothetical protein [Kosmotogales bacterium]